jgi:hypothetical protein
MTARPNGPSCSAWPGRPSLAAPAAGVVRLRDTPGCAPRRRRACPGYTQCGSSALHQPTSGPPSSARAGLLRVKTTGAVLGDRDGWDVVNSSRPYGGAWDGPIFVLTHHPEDATPADGGHVPELRPGRGGTDRAGGGPAVSHRSAVDAVAPRSAQQRFGPAAQPSPPRQPSPEAGQVGLSNDKAGTGPSYSDWTAAAKALIEGNSASGVTSAGGAGVAPQPGRSCRRLIHTVGRPAFFAPM